MEIVKCPYCGHLTYADEIEPPIDYCHHLVVEDQE